MKSRVRVRAPGKLFLSGEYVVLDGAPAIACAVDRYVSVRSIQARVDEDAQATRWREAAEKILRSRGTGNGGGNTALAIDSGPLYAPDGSKYGLGSSAAVAVGVAGALLAGTGGLPATDEQLRVATALHRAVQGPGGSGMDVAASLYGGVIAGTRGRVEVLPWPSGLLCAVIWTGQEADTDRAISSYRSAIRGASGAVTGALARLNGAAAAVREAWLSGAEAVLEALQVCAAALRDLDEAAKLGAYSSPHRHLHRLARAAGCVYKPSGAGGGDCGIAFARDPARIQSMRKSARESGYALLDLELAADGLSVGAQADQE